MKPFSSMAKNQASNSEIVTNANGDPTQNPSSPYYVDPSEDPTAVMVVTHVLEGKNYNVWAISMRRALIVKNKFKFVDWQDLKDRFWPPDLIRKRIYELQSEIYTMKQGTLSVKRMCDFTTEN